MLQPGVYTKSSDKNAKSSYAPGFITIRLIVVAALTLIIVMHMKLRVSTANTDKQK
jgi:hypothetical protein